ncbi:adenylyl-sulfate kinase [Pseudomonas sp. LD120]|uniref:adenylyl-sulfate kinase n=1 Tax=Pseudomonas sp. LD120 TaxID=485751 RepID=UPI0035320A9F
MFALGRCFESYVSTPFNICPRRVPKGLYQAALLGDQGFAGLDSHYEAADQADCVINTDGVELATA